MTNEQARQIAELLNTQNQLDAEYNAEKVLSAKNNYIFVLDDNSNVISVVELKKVQWYQREICHLSVHPSHKRQGRGKQLLKLAEEKARQEDARLLQCTIRDDNEPSKRLFEGIGFVHTSSFYNVRTEVNVTVWQKVLIPMR